MINVTLLKQTLAHIEANPNEWHQSWYRCGSGLCFAGWAAQLAGGRWYTVDPDAVFSDELIAESDDVPKFTHPARHGSDVRVTDASARAERVLGLTGGQAGDLFYARNTLADLRRIVAQLCELAEVTGRLRNGLAVETVREPGGWQVTSPTRAERYERPEASTVPGELSQDAFVQGEHEVYQIEHIARRPGGDMDVVVSATPYDHRPRAYISFRRDAGLWRPLVGRVQDLSSAVHLAEHESRFAGWDSPELAALLNTLEATA